jgi:hypothetical protein
MSHRNIATPSDYFRLAYFRYLQEENTVLVEKDKLAAMGDQERASQEKTLLENLETLKSDLADMVIHLNLARLFFYGYFLIGLFLLVFCCANCPVLSLLTGISDCLSPP